MKSLEYYKGIGEGADIMKLWKQLGFQSREECYHHQIREHSISVADLHRVNLNPKDKTLQLDYLDGVLVGLVVKREED